MRKLILSVFCILFVTLIEAQTNYKPGYVITLSKDTVYGQIDYRGDYTMGRVCRFLSEDGKKTEFTPNDITAYRFIDSKYFISLEVEKQKHFLEFLVQGKMNVYYLRDNKGDHYYIENEGKPLVELPYQEEIKTINDKQYFHKSHYHNGILNYYTQEAPQLKEAVENLEKPEHANLMKLARNYHNAVCEDGEECIVFERKIPLFQVKAEAVAGYYAFLLEKRFLSEGSDLQGLDHSFFGARVYLWLPRSSENLYMKIGLFYLNNQSLKEELGNIKIPIQFEYLYPKGLIRPTISGGISLYENIVLIPSYSVGLRMINRNNDRFSFSLLYDVEMLPISGIFPVFPSFHLVGHSLSLGASYTF